MEWDHALWTNRQQMMRALATVDAGVRILYVAPPRFVASTRFSGRTSRVHSAGPRIGVFTNRAHVRLYVLQPLLPVPNRVLQARAPRLLAEFAVLTTKTMLRRMGMRRYVAWVYGPGQHHVLDSLTPAAVCYDLVDDYLAQEYYARRRDQLEPVHERLMAQADLVLAASKGLTAAPALQRDAVYVVGNAADVDHFRQARRATRRRPPEFDTGDARPVIGFHGTLTREKLDLDLIDRVARMRPDWRFVFVGPVRDDDVTACLDALPNVVLVSAKDPDALLDYVAHFDAAWIPYADSAYVRGVNPLKLYEYMAAATPVVVAGAPIPDRLTHLVPCAQGPAEAAAALALALGEAGRSRALTCAAMADDFSWDAKARRCLALLEGHVASETPPATIAGPARPTSTV